MESLELQVLKELVDQLVLRVKLGTLDQLEAQDQLDQPGLWVRLELLEAREVLVLQECLAQTEDREHLAPKDSQEPLALQGLLEARGQQEQLVERVALVQPDQQGGLGLQVVRVPLVILEPVELQVPLGRQDQPDRKVR